VQRAYLEAVYIFKGLVANIDSSDTKVWKRLKKIEKNWDTYAAFYFVKGVQATNNPIEVSNYSTSLKTYRKKQFRSDVDIENQIKLSQIKMAGMLKECGRMLIEVFSRFMPFLASG